MSDDRGGGDRLTATVAAYGQAGDNYRAIDELRLKLLGLLPLATGAGIFLLLRGGGIPADLAVAVGAFGMVATLSLYFYELHGVEKCAHFIQRGQQLEQELGVRGSFTNRPHHIFGVVSELLPTMLIYPASFAGWLFLALDGVSGERFGFPVRGWVTGAVLAGGVAASSVLIGVMERTRPRRQERREQPWSTAATRDGDHAVAGSPLPE
jgi:hypothetical protein